jgi:hypothetical protein
MTKRILIVFAFFSFSFLRAQVPVFDKLEMLYSQNHYKIVYRKANRLLDVPDYDYNGWIGLMAPAGTPPAIISQIAAAVEHIAAQPETNDRLVTIGTEAAFTGPAGFRQILAQYRDNFAPVIRQLGIRAE